MKIANIAFASLLLVPAAFADDKKPMEGMPMDHKGMDMQMDQKAAGQTATATGTVKKIDTDKGTVTIAHGPVEALGWPSMTMGFKAQPGQLESLKEGDQVEFEFTSKGMDSTITRIEKQ
jgi:Cu(I)/Ag(I) efflux system periplasmic protein CusF